MSDGKKIRSRHTIIYIYIYREIVKLHHIGKNGNLYRMVYLAHLNP